MGRGNYCIGSYKHLEDVSGEKLMLKIDNGKLLLSIRNHFEEKIVFSDDIPVSNKVGHGYGTQSICYMTEKLGGNYQFMVEGNEFILRVII